MTCVAFSIPTQPPIISGTCAPCLFRNLRNFRNQRVGVTFAPARLRVFAADLIGYAKAAPRG